MIKKLLFIFLLTPAVSNAQYVPTNELEKDHVDMDSHKHIRGTYWHVLKRTTLSNPLNLYFRIMAYDNQYKLEIKASKAGVPFYVPRDAPLEFYMEDGSVVTVNNSEFQHSCKGCGSRKEQGDEPGVWLKYPLTAEKLDQFRNGYVVRIRFYAEDTYMGAPIKLSNSELFQEEASLIWEAVNK